MEVPEGREPQGDLPILMPVAVTISILAVLVAIASLMGHRTSTEQLLLQTRATDQWALFQAKNIRLHEMQSVADLLGALAAPDREKTEALREKYLKEVERYAKEKEEASERARELEKEREGLNRREDRFDAGEVLLQIGLIICSLTLLTKRKFFWYGGIAIGVLGAMVVASAFLLH